VFASVKRFLTQRLKLVVNEDKSSVRPSLGCEYLGFTFVGKRVTVKVAPKKLIAFKERIKELTSRSRGISMQRRLTDLNRYVRGWVGYFGLARQFEDIANLDGWIRRRVRMCYWKQWRYPRTKVKKLVALGVRLDMAIKHAISRKKYWRMSRTPAMRYAMTNKWPRATRLTVIKAGSGTSQLLFTEPPSADPHARFRCTTHLALASAPCQLAGMSQVLRIEHDLMLHWPKRLKSSSTTISLKSTPFETSSQGARKDVWYSEMLGGVGAAVRNDGGYPISSISDVRVPYAVPASIKCDSPFFVC